MVLFSEVYLSQFLDFSKDGNILGISNRGGGGHTTAMSAIQDSWKLNTRKESSFQIVDVIKDSFPGKIGKLISDKINETWNKAKKDGDIHKQEFLITGRYIKKGPPNQVFSEFVFFIPVFVATCIRLLLDRKITKIIDTQPLSTTAIVKAVRVINKLFHREIRVLKVMTDLPTSDCYHFYVPIKRLSKKDKSVFKLITTQPLVENGMSEIEWWAKFYGLRFDPINTRHSQVEYCDFPLRPAFLYWKNKEVANNHPVMQIKVNNSEEWQCIQSSLREKLERKEIFSEKSSTGKKQILNIGIKDQDFIGVVTIGSQAAEKTKNYVEDFIEVVRNKIKNGPDEMKYYFFIACGQHKVGSNDLFKQVAKLGENLPNELRGRLLIIPLGFQDDTELAALIHRANIGVFGGGGLTCMEIMSAATGRVFFHSESKIPKKIREKMQCKELQNHLLKGLAAWEKGNVRYGMQHKGGKIIIPGKLFRDTFVDIIRELTFIK